MWTIRLLVGSQVLYHWANPAKFTSLLVSNVGFELTVSCTPCKRDNQITLIRVVPTVGVEPTTFALRMRYSTSWVKKAKKLVKGERFELSISSFQKKRINRTFLTPDIINYTKITMVEQQRIELCSSICKTEIITNIIQPHTMISLKKELNFHLSALWLFIIPLYYLNYITSHHLLFYKYNILMIWCRQKDLNPWPSHYKWAALPTELWRH